MKKTLLIVFLITFALLAGAAFGQEFYPANQKTIAWDASENATLYRVFVRPVPEGDATLLGDTAATSYTATMPGEGKWFVGVQAVRELDGQVVAESTISWSSDAEACLDGNTFGIIYYLPPTAVGGLRVQ